MVLPLIPAVLIAVGVVTGGGGAALGGLGVLDMKKVPTTTYGGSSPNAMSPSPMICLRLLAGSSSRRWSTLSCECETFCCGTRSRSGKREAAD
jgi:hypothetical protein